MLTAISFPYPLGIEARIIPFIFMWDWKTHQISFNFFWFSIFALIYLKVKLFQIFISQYDQLNCLIEFKKKLNNSN